MIHSLNRQKAVCSEFFNSRLLLIRCKKVYKKEFVS